MVKALLILGLLLVGSTAWAGDGRPLPVDDTARVLSDAEWRIGLLSSDRGIADRLEIGVDHLYYALPLWNAHAKYQVYGSNEGLSVALRAGVYYGNTLAFWWYPDDESEATMWILPFEALVTIPISERLFVTPSVGFTAALGEGEVNYQHTEGIAGATQLTVGLNTEWSLSDLVLLGLKLQYSPYAYVEGNAEYQTEVGVTRIEIQATGSADPNALDNAFSAVGYMLLSWDTFHLRAGAGWGNITLPGVELVSVNRTPIVDFDMFWRF